MVLKSRKIKEALKSVGPGFITGAADDDPSGIATYSIAGAQFGYRLNWLTLFLLPAMISIQEMCGRIGMVTGRGLAGVIKKYHSRRLLVMAVSLLAIANVVNIGADLGIMASSMQMLLGFPFWYWIIVVAIFIAWMEIAVSYKTYSKYLKWLGLTLSVYIVTAFLVRQDWREVALATFVPHIDFKMDYIMTMVGFLGTTISPYLFFWQASEEVEEEIAEKKIRDFKQLPDVKPREIKKMRLDTKVGMLFSNLMTFFIILTTAATLNHNGIFSIDTPQQAAMALRPLAGDFAYLLFAMGIIGIGLQSIPVLAGSMAYAVAEIFDFKEGLSKNFSKAKYFYLVIALATVAGVIINLTGVNTMKALYYAAIINGVTAVPLIALIIKLSDDEKIVGRYKTSKLNRAIAWITFTFMLISVGLMLYQILGTTILVAKSK